MKRMSPALCILALVLGATLAIAQNDATASQPTQPPQPVQDQQRPAIGAPGVMPPQQDRRDGGHHMRRRGIVGVPSGKWWKNSELTQNIGLTDTQSQQIEKIFQDHRTELKDLHSQLEKEESVLEPMMDSDRPDETQVSGQIDRVAQARTALEKSNAHMLMAMRRVMTADQWKKLQQVQRDQMSAAGPRGPRGPGVPPPQDRP